MRYRRSKRVLWLIVLVIPVVVMSVGLWLTGDGETIDPATRGAKAPEIKPISVQDPSSWHTGHWLNDGVDAVMTWDLNPWKRRHGLGYHFQVLKDSDNPEDKAEVERLRRLGKEWHERILTRYPELARQPGKAVPKESNGSYQWSELVKRLKAEGKTSLLKETFPSEFSKQLEKGAPLDEQAAREWLERNRAMIEEIRTIALLPGHSTADIPSNEQMDEYLFWSRDATMALVLDARLAAGEGDLARALESIRAAGGLSDHLGEIETPTLLSTLMVSSNRTQIRNSVLSSILPSMSGGEVDVAEWENAVSPRVQQPGEFANILRGEWNLIMPSELLPVLSDNADSNLPVDADHLVESYTRHIQTLVQQAENLSSGPAPTASVQHLSKRSRDLAAQIGMLGGYRSQDRWERNQAQVGMTQAAFAILRGKPVPNDPISGEPYVWDPVKRTLALPSRYGKTSTRSITIPAL